jgi:hypothetical protein
MSICTGNVVIVSLVSFVVNVKLELASR